MSAEKVRFQMRGPVGIVTLDAPPVNALTPDVRAGLGAALDMAEGQTGLRALVLIGEGEAFSAGLDLAEMRRPAAGVPTVADLARRLELMPVPVIAALGGRALGAGAELALACHWRLAVPDALIGLPEISLGVVPGAGGTQRLPRLAGAEVALGMLLSGKSAPMDLARKVGLVDGVVDGHLLSGAVRFAEALVEAGTAPRPTADRRHYLKDGTAYLAAVEARRGTGHPPGAAARIVQCVEAALLLPIEQGLELEAVAHAESLDAPEARGLQHAYLAERRCPPTLLQRDGRLFRPTEAGEAVVARLDRALRTAAERVEAAGWSAAGVDAALRAYGFRRGVLLATNGEDAAPARADMGVVRRVVAAVMAEGARLLEDGSLGRAGDVDALALHGLHWPRETGGPMMGAELLGLDGLRRDMGRWAEESPVWSAPTLVSRAAAAGGFSAVPPR